MLDRDPLELEQLGITKPHSIAGSERIKASSATGQTFQEARHINQVKTCTSSGFHPSKVSVDPPQQGAFTLRLALTPPG